MCFDGKYTWAYKKFKKSACLRTYYIGGHLKQPRGPRVGQPCTTSMFLTSFNVYFVLGYAFLHVCAFMSPIWNLDFVRQELASFGEDRFATPTLLAGNAVIETVTADSGKQGRQRAEAYTLDLSKWKQRRQRCLFHNRIIGKFMVSEDRIEINFSIVSLIIFEINIIVEQK